MIDVWQNVFREEVSLSGVGVATQDERANTNLLIGLELGQYLVGIPNDCGPCA